MTVTYTAQVATCRGFGCFLKLLFRWRGSIYKLVWLDLSLFLLLYYILNIMYRLALDEDQKRQFESVVKYCSTYSNLIPLSFVLGFYVSIVMTRWWNQYTSIPWPDPIAVFVSANVHGQDERGRLMRRTVMRYVCLCLTMVLINISPRVKKRFPSLNHLIEAGLLVESERDIMESLNSKFPRHSKHWMPIVWAASIITRARKEGRIRDDFAVKTIIDELNKFRGQCGLLISYDTISVPLVYTQVVTLAVYSYFLTCIVGQQWVENKVIDDGFVNLIDLYFPLFTTLQFFFYMGWLKVAESLINPFGEDDDDFEVNWMVDRNLQVSYMIVDEMHHEHPMLIRDQYWDEVLPAELPYTVASEQFREEEPVPSTANIEIRKSGMQTVPSSLKVDDMVGKKSLEQVNYKFPEPANQDVEADDNASGITFVAGRRHRNTSESSNSLASIAGSLTRVNTVASALKRFLSRDETRSGQATPDTEQTRPRFPGSASSASLRQAGGAAATRIAETIEEVDEQMTITSMRNAQEQRPTAKSLFDQGPPPPSQPIDVPQSSSQTSAYTRTQSAVGHMAAPYAFPNPDNVFSTSVPTDFISEANTAVNTPTTELDGEIKEAGIPEGTAPPDDAFERLRLERERERIERTKVTLARAISTLGGAGGVDAEAVAESLIAAAATGSNSVMPSRKNSFSESQL